MIVKCPRCGRPAHFDASNPARPFCSERCRTLDLGAWADEEYRVPERTGDPDHLEVEGENATFPSENPPSKPNLN